MADSTPVAYDVQLPLSVGLGHVGLPRYDALTKQWTFNRHPGISRPLKFLNPTKNVWTLSDPLKASQSHERARELQRNIHLISRDIPELVPAQDLLPELAHFSEAVRDLSNVSGSAFGPRLAIGNASFNKAKNSVQICAIPCGESGDCVKLIQINPGVQGWHENENRGIEAQNLTGYVGHWSGTGSAVLQTRFSGLEEGSEEYLGIRLTNEIIICRPFVQLSSIHATPRQTTRFPPSPLISNPILTIRSQSRHRGQFADVTFNSWLKRQLATIDQDGHWKVEEISGYQRAARSTYSAKTIAHGSFVKTCSDYKDEEKVNDAIRDDDGWFRIMWICNGSTIITCGRRALQLYDIFDPFRQIPEAVLGLHRNPDWILDAQGIPKHRNHLIVLTSTHILLVNVETLLQQSDESENTAELSTCLKWKHFRDREDITMQSCIVLDSDDSVVVMVYSRLNKLLTCVRFNISDAAEPEVSLSDPFTLDLRGAEISPTISTKAISTITCSRLGFANLEASEDETEGSHLYENRDVTFLQIIALYENFEIGQYICYSTPSSDTVVPAFDWHKGPKSFKSDYYAVDGDMAKAKQGKLDPGRKKRNKRNLNLSHMKGKKSLDPWTVNHEDVYSAISLKGSRETTTLDEEFSRIRSLLEGDENYHDMSRTIHELIRTTLAVDDVNAVSSSFDDLRLVETIPSQDPTSNLRIQAIARNPSLNVGLPAGADFSLSELYSVITGDWIGNIPGVSGRLLQTKEWISRKAAVDICLSAFAIRSSMVLVPQPAEDDGREQEDIEAMLDRSSPPVVEEPEIYSLPLRNPTLGKGKAPLSPISEFERPASQCSQKSDNGDRNRSRAPGMTPSSMSSTGSTAYNEAGPLRLTTLRKYAQVTKPPVLLSGTMARLLSHWTIGEDPDDYDYEAISTRLVDEEGGPELSAKARRRIEKNMKKRLLKQQRQNSLPIGPDPSRLLLSKPLPRITMGSSPGPGVASSSLPLIATQTETGRHGGRPTKRRKVRMTGF